MGTTAQLPAIIQPYKWLVHCRWWMSCYIWYSEVQPERAAALPSSLLAVPNVTAHASTASAPTSYYSMWHYNCQCPRHKYTNFQTGRPTFWLDSVYFLKNNAEYQGKKNIENEVRRRTKTRSSAVAERSRNVCPWVVLFNSTIPRAQSFITSYFSFRFTSACN